MNTIYAFGEPVPDEFISELLEDGIKEEEITSDFIETLMHYEYMANQDNL